MQVAESSKPKILVVDDEENVRDMLSDVLSTEGYTITTATDGKDALQKTLTDKPDLILLDIRMPKLDGVTFCKALRVYKETQSIPIIILTAFSTRDRLEESMLAGADDFIAKPFDATELKIRVRSLLKLKHVTDEVDRLQKYIVSLREMRGEKRGAPDQPN